MRRATEASHFRCGEDGAGDLSSPAGSAGSCLDQDEIWVSSVQTRLMEWYREARRDLPWRANRDPYRILVSEMMLVQTTVTAVIPYFDRFLNQFPDAGALAAAAESDVLKAWEGLGYYRRARQLQAAAQTIVSEHGGAIPNDPALVRALPGVGRYIAGAILSFAFDRPEPIVEANSQRVLARLLAIRENLKAASTLDRLWRAAARLVPARSAGIFNQGLMELGALVCTPREPACLVCPLSTLCEARRLGLQDRLPIVTPRPKPLAVTEACAIVASAGRILIVQRAGRAMGAILGISDYSPERRGPGGQVIRRAGRSGRGDQTSYGDCRSAEPAAQDHCVQRHQAPSHVDRPRRPGSSGHTSSRTRTDRRSLGRDGRARSVHIQFA